MLEQIQCKVCKEYAEVQIGTEQYAARLCYECQETVQYNEDNAINEMVNKKS